MKTKITYMYRDASNYKVHNQAILEGSMTPEQWDAINASLEDGEYFIPEAVGMPEERFDDGWTEDDHHFFEMGSYEPVLDDVPLDTFLTIDQLVKNFQAMAGKWDDYAAGMEVPE